MSAVRLDGRTVLVTGAGRGLGRAHAMLMAARGAHVVVNDLGADTDGSGRASGPADAVVAEIHAGGGSAESSGHDITDKAEAEAMIAQAKAKTGRIDAVVHNAGILRDRTLVNLSAEDVEAVIAVHLKAAFWTLIPAVAAMREAGHGRVILTTSSSGLFGNFGQSNYGAAKMGLVGLMRVLAMEGAKAGILVNTVAPTARTRMTEDLLGPLADQLDPDHVAPLVTWLASAQCTIGNRIFSTGGGRYASVFLGLTPGWTRPEAGVASPEEIAGHMDQILDREGFIVPENGFDEVQAMVAALSGRARG